MKLADIVVLIMNLLTLVTLALAIFTDWNEGGCLTLALRFWLAATVVNLFVCTIKRKNRKDDRGATIEGELQNEQPGRRS